MEFSAQWKPVSKKQLAVKIECRRENRSGEPRKSWLSRDDYDDDDLSKPSSGKA